MPENLFQAGKAAVDDAEEIKVTISGAGAKLWIKGRDGSVKRRDLDVFAWQAFSTGYTIRLAEKMRVA